jgi:hypothetical protein
VSQVCAPQTPSTRCVAAAFRRVEAERALGRGNAAGWLMRRIPFPHLPSER